MPLPVLFIIFIIGVIIAIVTFHEKTFIPNNITRFLFSIGIVLIAGLFVISETTTSVFMGLLSSGMALLLCIYVGVEGLKGSIHFFKSNITLNKIRDLAEAYSIMYLYHKNKLVMSDSEKQWVLNFISMYPYYLQVKAQNFRKRILNKYNEKEQKIIGKNFDRKEFLEFKHNAEIYNQKLQRKYNLFK